MNSTPVELVTEGELPAFRRERLSPEALLEMVISHVRVLVRVAVGVGKSWAVDSLLEYEELYQRFDLVIYSAPMRRIVDERTIASGARPSPVKHYVFKPRPAERCGPYAEEWADLERRGLSALAKDTLCSQCRAAWPEGVEPCFWPDQFSRLSDVQLVFVTEQYLHQIRSLVPLLVQLTGASRPLVILDEANLLDACFDVELRPQDLRHLRDAIAEVGEDGELKEETVAGWMRSIGLLLSPRGVDLENIDLDLPRKLFGQLSQVQAAGVRLSGPKYRCIAQDLALFPWSRREERWVDADGVVHFTARPYLYCHALLLSAHLTAVYAGHRLGVGPLPSPFEDTRFQHTGSRVINVQSRAGASRHHHRNRKQILDTFAVALLRNVLEGRTSVVVSRKKRRGACAEYLAERLRGWGVAVEFVIGDPTRLPSSPDPRVVPVLHYGIRGVNDFQEYDSAYCLDSYYMNTAELNRSVQEFEPESFRIELKIAHGPGQRLRRVELAHRADPDLDREWLGNIYLRKMEVDPVIQVVGRVRFQTRPREVVTFQMHDMAREIPGCIEVPSLVALRHELGLPRAREIDTALRAERGRELMASGLTAKQAAAQIGIGRSALFEAFKACESPEKPLIDTLRVFRTLAASSAGAEATT